MPWYLKLYIVKFLNMSNPCPCDIELSAEFIKFSLSPTNSLNLFSNDDIQVSAQFMKKIIAFMFRNRLYAFSAAFTRYVSHFVVVKSINPYQAPRAFPLRHLRNLSQTFASVRSANMS